MNNAKAGKGIQSAENVILAVTLRETLLREVTFK